VPGKEEGTSPRRSIVIDTPAKKKLQVSHRVVVTCEKERIWMRMRELR
jgi:hypothetical protein